MFLRSAAIVAASVLLSRVLGFLREWAIARKVGSNAITDAYYAAFTVPDVLNYLLAGGALSITFLPVFLEYFTGDRKKEAWEVFSSVLTTMTCILFTLVLVAEVYAGTLTHWIAPGFTDEQHRIVTSLTRIMLPAQAFFFIGGVLSAVQYAQGHFLVPSLAPLIYNGMIIGFGFLLADRLGIAAFSWGVFAGSLVGNCLIQMYGARRLGAQFRLTWNLRHPGFRRFVRLSLPIMLGFSLIFIDDWAIRWCGSFLAPASITWLNYGKTLMRVVVGIFGQAAGVASFPILARLAAEKKLDEMKESLREALQHVILAIVPICVLMAILSQPIVFVLFSRTRMTSYDIEQTAFALMIFLASAVGWGVQGIVGRGFYALGDTITPTVIGSGLSLAWLPVYWFLAQRFQYVGLAAASSAGVLVYTGWLWIALYRRLRIPVVNEVGYLLRTLAAALSAGLAAYALRSWMEHRLSPPTLISSLAVAAAATAIFAVIFVPMASRTRIASWRNLRSTFLRK